MAQKNLQTGLLILTFTSLPIFFSCNNSASNPSEAQITDTTFKPGPTTPLNDTNLQAIDHKILITYLPVKIEGYKAIGYPDLEDKYDGLATGETRSPMSTPKYISFAKQQYEKGDIRAEVSIGDFLPGQSAFQGQRRIFLSLEKNTENQVMRKANLSLPETEAAFDLYPEENKGDLRLFVCNRFIITIQVVNTKDAETVLKKIAAAIRVSDLVKDHCKEPAAN